MARNFYAIHYREEGRTVYAFPTQADRETYIRNYPNAEAVGAYLPRVREYIRKGLIQAPTMPPTFKDLADEYARGNHPIVG